MPDLVINLPQDLKERVENLAALTGSTLGECVQVALFEFVEQWETHFRDIGMLDGPPPEALPEAVNY